MTDSDNRRQKRKSHRSGGWIAIGAGVGAAIGAGLGGDGSELANWLAVGVALGVALEYSASGGRRDK